MISTGLVLSALLIFASRLDAGHETLNQFIDWAGVLVAVADAIGAIVALVEGVNAMPAVIGRIRHRIPVTAQALDEAVVRLAHQVLADESGHRALLLSTEQPTAATVDLRFEVETEPPFTDRPPFPHDGSLTEIGRYYTGLPQRRLVVLGEPGSGKTALAVELIIQLLAGTTTRIDAEPPAGVPVRFSLPAWPAGQSLTSWLAGELAKRFTISAHLARTLLDRDRILPVLDGLDEMDAPGTDQVRASTALRQINRHLAVRPTAPVVITCRTEDYQRLREHAGVALRSSAEIVIRSLTARQIREYLDREYDSSADQDARQQWTPLLDRIRKQQDRRLLTVLQTPWRLTLAVAYHGSGGDLGALLPTPAESAAPPSDHGGDSDPYLRRVTQVLVSNFVRTRAAVYQPGRYTAAEVERWCRAMARSMGSQVNLVPSRWRPPTTGPSLRYRYALTVGAGTALLALAAEYLTMRTGQPDILTVARSLRRDWTLSLDTLALVANIAWRLFMIVGCPLLALRQAAALRTAPALINLRQLGTRQGRRRLAGSVLRGLGIGLIPGLGYGLVCALASSAGRRITLGADVLPTHVYTLGIGKGLAYGLAGGLVFGLAYGLRPTVPVVTDPRDPLYGDLAIWVAIGLAAGFGYTLPTWLSDTVAGRPSTGIAVTAGLALCGAMAISLAFGVAGTAWLRYCTAVTSTALRGETPWRFGRFLRWAHEAGVLRTVGDAYQFRHLELHAWLRQQPLPRQATVGADPNRSGPRGHRGTPHAADAGWTPAR